MKHRPPLFGIRIIHESNDFVVIDKPSGIDSQNSRPDRPSVVEWLDRSFGFQGLVHRLDFGTSGVMICALNPDGAKRLTKLMQGGSVQRSYQALVIGTGLTQSGSWDTPLAGQEAITHYLVKETFPNAMLLQLDLETGRKHQIRQHCFEAGHPIIGDHLYKKRGSDRLLKRPALHSFKLQFEGKTYEAPLPDDMAALLQKFRKSHADFKG